jgi:competence protein ComEC
VFPPAPAASYSAENWLLADGEERDVAKATDESVFRCDTLGCIGVVKGKKVALIRHPGALEEDCRIADIVIAPFTVGKKCRAARVIVDRRMLRAEGAHALYVEGLSIRTETVAAARGKRPWAPDRAIVTARQAAFPQWDAGGKEGGAGGGSRSDGNPEN